MTAFGLWESFLSWSDAKRAADAEAKNQTRDQALGQAQAAQTPEAAYAAQDGIVNSEP